MASPGVPELLQKLRFDSRLGAKYEFSHRFRNDQRIQARAERVVDLLAETAMYEYQLVAPWGDDVRPKLTPIDEDVRGAALLEQQRLLGSAVRVAAPSLSVFWVGPAIPSHPELQVQQTRDLGQIAAFTLRCGLNPLLKNAEGTFEIGTLESFGYQGDLNTAEGRHVFEMMQTHARILKMSGVANPQKYAEFFEVVHLQQVQQQLEASHPLGNDVGR